jgi:hypothetical protein
MREGPTHQPMKAQLRSASGRSSKVIKDREAVEAVVEVAGAGRLVLNVDGAGGYSLRGYSEAAEAPSNSLLAVGVMRSDEIVAIQPGEASGGIEHDPG